MSFTAALSLTLHLLSLLLDETLDFISERAEEQGVSPGEKMGLVMLLTTSKQVSLMISYLST